MTGQIKIQLTFSEDELKTARTAYGVYTAAGGAETSFNKYLKAIIMEAIKHEIQRDVRDARGPSGGLLRHAVQVDGR